MQTSKLGCAFHQFFLWIFMQFSQNTPRSFVYTIVQKVMGEKLQSRIGLVRKWTIFNGWTKWKSWKFSFSRNARIHGCKHRAAMPWRQQSRTEQRAVIGWRVSAQTTSSYITARPWLPGLIVGPCPSEESLCCPAQLPTRPPLFSPSLGPQSLRLRVLFPCICSPPVCIIPFFVKKFFENADVSPFGFFRAVLYVSYIQSHHFPWLQPHELQSIRSFQITAIRTHHPISHVSLEEAHSRLPHTGFPPKGLLLSRQGGCSHRPYQG